MTLFFVSVRINMAETNLKVCFVIPDVEIHAIHAEFPRVIYEENTIYNIPS